MPVSVLPFLFTTSLQEPGSKPGRTRQWSGRPTYIGRESRIDAKHISCHPPTGHKSLWLVERSAARRRTCRTGHRIPASHRYGSFFQQRTALRCIHRSFGWSTCQEYRIQQRRRIKTLSGAHHVDTQYQHLPWSALGTGTGNLRRRSLPHRADGYGSGTRPARTWRREVW